MVAKHKRRVAAKQTGQGEPAVPEPSVPKAAKVTKPKTAKQSRQIVPKAAKPTVHEAATPSKPTSSQPPKPKLAPTKPSKSVPEKKRKLVKETPDEPSPAKGSKGGLVGKRRKSKSLLKLVDEFADGGVFISEPRVDDEEVDYQRGVKLSLKDLEARNQSPAHTMVIQKPESGRIQYLLECDEVVTPVNKDKDASYREITKINTGVHDEGQARSNPVKQDKGQAGSNPEFTTTTYLNVQENLKLLTEDHVILEEPASSIGTLSSLQNIDKELSFTDQFFVEMPREEELEKTNAESEVQSMVTVPIQQDTSSVPLMTTPIIDLIIPQPDSLTVHAPLPTSTATTTTTTLPPPPPQPQQSTTYPILLQRIDQLQADLAEARKKRRKKSDSPRTPSGSTPPLPPSLGASSASRASGSSGACLCDDDLGAALKVSPRKDWWKPCDDDERPATLEPVWVIPTSYIPDVVNSWANYLATTYQAPAENSLLEKTEDMQTFMNCSRWKSVTRCLQYQIDWANLEVDQVRIDISRPLPLIGPPGHVTMQTQFFFNKDLDYLRYGSKGSRPTLSISKMKAARYTDFGLELLAPEQIWINDVCTYDISASYVIRKRVEDLQLGIESYQKQLNLTKPGWDAKGFEYKHDYTNIESPRVVVFSVCNNERKIMRFNEIYKFSDGTLTNILEALDYRVKEYKVNRLNPATTYQAPAENSLLEKTEDMQTFMNCSRWKSVTRCLQYQIDWANLEVDQVRIDISRPLPLIGPPGHVTMQTQFFFNKDLDYLRYGSKGSGPALLISKMKAARYTDFGLELLAPEQIWINDVCTYDISASYGISHWWFNRHRFYIDRHITDSRRKKQLNLTKPGWDAKGFEYKHDYTNIESPRVVVFPVCNNERKIMRFNEIYKFSDGTLTNILEALDYRVKEYKVNQLNPGMNTGF
nr:hypothetical protein [Tanacetum cinerariifolium]